MVIRWQVAIAAGFFIVATMFIRSTINQARHDPGIDMDRIAVAVLNFDNGEWDEARIRRVVDRVMDEGRGDRAIETIAASTGLPFGVPSLQIGVAIRTTSRDAKRAPVTARRGDAVAVSDARSRDCSRPRLQRHRRTGGAAAIIVSELAARQWFGSADPVGRTLIVRRRPAADTAAVVVGVARDTDVRWIYTDRRALVYLPLSQHFASGITLTARSTGAASRAVPALREAIRKGDPDLAVTAIGDRPSLLAGPFVIVGSLGRGALYLGGLSLLLSMVGLFGVQSHVVAHRTREIGVRMSVGASARQIKLMVLKDGYRPVIEGLMLGLWGGVAGRLMMRSYMELEDVTIVDPWMLFLTPIPLSPRHSARAICRPRAPRVSIRRWRCAANNCLLLSVVRALTVLAQIMLVDQELIRPRRVAAPSCGRATRCARGTPAHGMLDRLRRIRAPRERPVVGRRAPPAPRTGEDACPGERLDDHQAGVPLVVAARLPSAVIGRVTGMSPRK